MSVIKCYKILEYIYTENLHCHFEALIVSAMQEREQRCMFGVILVFFSFSVKYFIC